MAEGEITNNSSKEGVNENKNNKSCINGTDKTSEKKASMKDPETFCCLLQPGNADSSPDYIGIRRFLLARKAESSSYRRLVSSIFIFILFFCLCARFSYGSVF